MRIYKCACFDKETGLALLADQITLDESCEFLLKESNKYCVGETISSITNLGNGYTKIRLSNTVNDFFYHEIRGVLLCH